MARVQPLATKGPKGDPGNDGGAGPAGPQGPAGAAGAAGAPGTTLHAGLTDVAADQHHTENHPHSKHTSQPTHAQTTGQGVDDHHTENHPHSKHTSQPTHAQTTGQGANDHHNQAHPETDHTTHPTHASTTGQGVNDHHNRDHADAQHTDLLTKTGTRRLTTGSDVRAWEIKRVAGQTKNLMTFISEAAESGAETGNGSAVLARISNEGGAGFQGIHCAPGANLSGVTATQALWIQPFSDMAHIVMDQVTGQTGAYILVRNTSGQTIFTIDSQGNLAVKSPDSVSRVLSVTDDAGAVAGGLYSASTPSLGARAILLAVTAATIPLYIKAAASQTADLTDWNDSSNALLSRVNKAGYFMTRKSTVPADADVATGELAIWFDKTNGAAKFMVKAKQADGTVRTGSLALA